MSLVKSPVLTPAKLAANRANSAKSTGPRTARGKQAVTLNRMKHACRARGGLLRAVARGTLRQQLEVAHLYAALFCAVGPRPDELECVEALAAHLWRIKRIAEGWLREPGFKAAVQANHGWLPYPHLYSFKRPGWTVKVAVVIRRDRGETGRQSDPLSWWDGKRPLHVQVMVRCSSLRPWRPSEKLQREIRQALARRNNVTGPSGGRVTFKATISKILSNLIGCLAGKPRIARGGGQLGAGNVSSGKAYVQSHDL